MPMASLEQPIGPEAQKSPILIAMVSRWCVGVLVVCATFVGHSAAAQTVVSGTVTDPQSAVVRDARVALLSGQNEVQTTRTDAQGRYRFDAISPGTYVVVVTAPGFQTATSAAIALTAGQSVTRDLSLALAGTTDFVSVEGRASAAGYRAERVSSLGPLGSARLLDAPYTVNVLPSELLINGQVKNFKEASKYLPLVEFQEMQGSEILRPATRGMQGSNMQNARMDGMGIVVTGANSMESLQQIEVLNGIGAALYGPANPSGMFNFIPKRPTERAVRRATLNYDGRSITTGQVDFGGRVSPGRRFGYRVNALGGNGETFVNGSELTRKMISAAGDVRPFEHTVVEAFYSHYNLEQRGFPGWFTYGRANNRTAFVLVPDAPDAARQGYGQPEAGVDLESRIGQLRVRHQLSSNWSLSVGALDQLVERDISTQVNALTDNVGNYTASLASGFAPRFRVFSNLSHLNGRLTTGRIGHDVAVGVTGYTFKSYSDVTNPTAASVRLGTANVASPLVFPLPAGGIPTHLNLFLSSSVHQQGISIADHIGLGGGWSVRASVSQDWIWTDNYNNARVRTGGDKDDGVSPLLSVIYKPQPRMTLYATWGSSLQQGDLAPGTALNAGQGLAPYRTHQEEIGYKIALGTIDVATAWFRLERPFANLDPTDNVFRISGDQLNYGVETMVTGRIGSRLVTYSGFTVLDPTMTKTLAPEANDKQFVGIPAWKSSLLGEYRIPALSEAFVSLNWQLVGRRPIDDANTAYTPAYNVVDTGVRYAHVLKGAVATWRLNVNNIGNAQYWSTLGPGNITGTNVGSYTAHLGQPRTVAASMEVAF
jgi:iron complex outermembrane recepter protein